MSRAEQSRAGNDFLFATVTVESKNDKAISASQKTFYFLTKISITILHKDMYIYTSSKFTVIRFLSSFIRQASFHLFLCLVHCFTRYFGCSFGRVLYRCSGLLQTLCNCFFHFISSPHVCRLFTLIAASETKSRKTTLYFFLIRC